MPRRFRPSWSVEEQEACFVVRDHDGQQLACVYFEDEPGRRSAAKLLTKDETRQIVHALYPLTGGAAVRCVPSSTNGTFVGRGASSLNRPARGGIHSMFVVGRRNLVAHRNLAGHRNLVGRRTLVVSDNNIALAQAPLRRPPQWSTARGEIV